MQLRPLRTVGLLLSALLISACSNLKPLPRDTEPAPLPAKWQSPLPETNNELTEQLLALVNDQQLEKLVDITLAANYDLRQTALRLEEQRLVTDKTDAARGPKLDLNASSQRSKASTTSNSHSLSLDLSWELDVWGRLADQQAASEADLQALQQDYLAARNSLAARTIQHWIDLVLRQQIIDAEQAWLVSLEDTERSIAERYRQGLSGSNALADLETARVATAQVRSRLEGRQQEYRDVLRQLAALQGTPAKVTLELPNSLPEIANPPIALPAQALAKRPDIQAAYQRILAAEGQAAAAHKALLPSFTLSASLSQARPSIGDLLSGSAAWQLLGQLSAPLFDGGSREADAKIADHGAQRQYLAYQQTLLNALNEVELTLDLEASLARQQVQLGLALEHAQRSLEHYQARYRDGLNDILDLLSAKQSAFDAQIQLLETRRQRLTNRIQLGLALGLGV